MPRLPEDVRRAQLVESALIVAETGGLDSVTARAVANEAGVSLGLLHFRFESMDELVTTMGESLILELSESLQAGFGHIREVSELRGLPGLRQLLSVGIGGMWPIIRATPDRQLLTYEITAHSLRRAATDPTTAAAVRQYQTMDDEAVRFLEVCAELTGVSWRTSAADVARFALAGLDGLVLRWLVDRDDDAIIAALDDLAEIITAKATEVPDSDFPDRPEDSAAASDDAGGSAGEQRDELLARAVIEALAEGMSWEQIGARLGVSRPSRSGTVCDRDWQDAIVDQENARARRIQPGTTGGEKPPPRPGNNA
ncbi:TetR/AcrR family transcriptional regulator [Rhodococcus opacus]|uniref:TetR/AcrR family transcriptional regulator n=1 Tax=Rhodococcus opacus TaxID=37919 RepID=UPI00247381C7|nr:TetR/AcrR family transcriptional regulator [Rhodococcus opacus]